jgi:hypothetical protein
VIRGDHGLTVTINRVQGASGPVIGTYATVDGSAIAGMDYGPVSGILSWSDGNSSPQSFGVAVSPQALAGHTFYLAILSAQGAGLGANMNTVIKIVAAGIINVSWAPPLTNTDGSPLTDLAGYYVCFASAQNPSGQTIQITDPATTAISIGDLSPGTYYVTTMAYNTAGILSSPTGAVSTIIQ